MPRLRGLSRTARRDRPRRNITIRQGLFAMESANDMKAHSKTYGSFIGALKWSVPLIALITLLVVVLIAD